MFSPPLGVAEPSTSVPASVASLFERRRVQEVELEAKLQALLTFRAKHRRFLSWLQEAKKSDAPELRALIAASQERGPARVKSLHKLYKKYTQWDLQQQQPERERELSVETSNDADDGFVHVAAHDDSRETTITPLCEQIGPLRQPVQPLAENEAPTLRESHDHQEDSKQWQELQQQCFKQLEQKTDHGTVHTELQSAMAALKKSYEQRLQMKTLEIEGLKRQVKLHKQKKHVSRAN